MTENKLILDIGSFWSTREQKLSEYCFEITKQKIQMHKFNENYGYNLTLDEFNTITTLYEKLLKNKTIL